MSSRVLVPLALFVACVGAGVGAALVVLAHEAHRDPSPVFAGFGVGLVIFGFLAALAAHAERY